jgi:integrase
MPRKRRSERTRDSVSIYDVWAAKGRREGKRWVYRVWDNQVRKYRRQAFADQPVDDANRKKPGCAAGDAWATKQLAKFQLGQDSATVVTLRTAGESFLGVREALGRSASQLGIIRFVLEAACAAGVGDLTDRTVPDLVQRWLGSLKASPRGKPPSSEASIAAAKARKAKQTAASPRTKNRYLTVLRSIGNHAVRRRMLTYNPFDAVERFSEARRFRRGYTIDELRRLVSDDRRDDHWWLFVVLAAYTGLRSETLRSLTWNMVDWQANRIRVPAAITKTNADVRVPIQPELRAILEDSPGIGSSPILPTRIAAMTSDQANVETQAYLRRCGIEPNGRSVHAFRHTAASLLTATGLSPFLVMDAVGHLSTITSKHYARGADDYRDRVKSEKWTEGEFKLRDNPDGQKSSANRRETINGNY